MTNSCILFVVVSFLPCRWLLAANETPLPLADLIEKHKPKVPNIDDPDLANWHARLKNSIRFEIESDGLNEIKRYMLATKGGYVLTREVFAEYRGIGDLTRDLLLSARFENVGGRLFKGPKEDEKRLKKFVIAMDCATSFPVFDLPETLEPQRLSRLCYLSSQLRRLHNTDNPEDELLGLALWKVVWTRGALASKVLKEQLIRFETDMALLPEQSHGIPVDYRKKIAAVGRQIEMAKNFERKNLAEVIVDARNELVSGGKESATAALEALFDEYFFEIQKAEELRDSSLHALNDLYGKSEEGSEKMKLRLLARCLLDGAKACDKPLADVPAGKFAVLDD